jgi:hypothetical protein
MGKSSSKSKVPVESLKEEIVDCGCTQDGRGRTGAANRTDECRAKRSATNGLQEMGEQAKKQVFPRGLKHLGFGTS